MLWRPGVNVPPGHYVKSKERQLTKAEQKVIIKCFSTVCLFYNICNKSSATRIIVKYLVPTFHFGYLKTYCSWPRVRNFSGVRSPLIVVPMFMREGSIKDVSDVRHGIHTHCRTFKHRATDRKRSKKDSYC